MVLAAAKGDWNEEEDMKRRGFLGALIAASLGGVLAQAQNAAQAVANLAGRLPG